MEERLRDELEIRRSQAQKQKESALKAAEEAKKLEMLRKSLRGSEYTLDHRGQVSVLSGVLNKWMHICSEGQF
jgi:hypothetical protein